MAELAVFGILILGFALVRLSQPEMFLQGFRKTAFKRRHHQYHGAAHGQLLCRVRRTARAQGASCWAFLLAPPLQA